MKIDHECIMTSNQCVEIGTTYGVYMYGLSKRAECVDVKVHEDYDTLSIFFKDVDTGTTFWCGGSLNFSHFIPFLVTDL